jgi:drug/metabolite transporter (DMT)-like permease
MRSALAARLWRAAYLLLFLAVLFWSANFVVGRAFALVIPPISLAFWRWVGATLLVMSFALPHVKRDLPVILRYWPRMLLLGAIGVSCFNSFAYIGLQTTTAINGVLLQSTMPVVILLCTFLFFRERPSSAQLVGVLLSMLGVLFIVARGRPLDLMHLGFHGGDAWIIAAILTYGAYSALLRIKPPMHPLSFLAATFLAGTLFLVPFYLWELSTGRRIPLEPATRAVVAYVAIGPSLLSYLFYNRGIELLGANRAGQFMYLVPAIGSILAVIFLGESFEIYHAVGIGLIAAGVTLATRKPARAAAA